MTRIEKFMSIDPLVETGDMIPIHRREYTFAPIRMLSLHTALPLSRKPMSLLFRYFTAGTPSNAFSFSFACPFSESFSSAFL
jgi:hypothetical protein